MDFNIQQTLKPLHVAIVPTPGLGHLIPLIELAKRLVVHHNFAVTFIIPNDGSSITPQKKALEAVNLQSISSTFLPPIDLDDLPKDAHIVARIILTMTRSLSALRDSLKVLNESTRVVALIADVLGSDAFDVAIECNVAPYLFWSSNAMSLSFGFYLPSLDETTSCAYQDMLEPVQLPGCVPLHGRDFLDPVHDRNNQGYKATLSVSKKFKLAYGIMVNSFMDLEPEIFKALKEAQVSQGFPAVYPVGPMIKPSSTSKSDGEHECLSWLDSQPRGSVLFVAFGSGGTHSLEQTKELALGLEMSGQRFLWVVRSPNETTKIGTYFSSNAQQKDALSFLPDGFLERTKGVGLAVPSWAPQIQVLSHESTGGFLTHCGWNSALESIVNGVPLIAWPLYAEQPTNAVLLADDIKIAWRVKMNDKGIVEAQDIAKYARGLIEGDEGRLLRNKMKELKEAAKVALSQQGSSTKSLAEVAEILKGHE